MICLLLWYLRSLRRSIISWSLLLLRLLVTVVGGHLNATVTCKRLSSTATVAAVSRSVRGNDNNGNSIKLGSDLVCPDITTNDKFAKSHISINVNGTETRAMNPGGCTALTTVKDKNG